MQMSSRQMERFDANSRHTSRFAERFSSNESFDVDSRQTRALTLIFVKQLKTKSFDADSRQTRL